MGRYSVIVEYKNNEKQVLKLKQREKEMNKALLEQLDYVLTGFENQEEFYKFVVKTFNPTSMPVASYFTYRAKGQDKKMNIIYNNLGLRKISGDILTRKLSGEKEPKIKTNDDYFLQVLNKIKTYSVSPISKYAISKMPYIIKQKLEEYVKMYELESNEKYDELEHITMSLKAHLSDYRVFRDTITALSQIEKFANKNKIAEPVIKQITLEEYNKMLEEKQNMEYDEELKQIAEENANLKERLMKISSNETPIEEIAKMIKDANLKEVYSLTNGDIDQIIEMLGTEKCDSLSINDKYILGINKKLVKERVE